MSRKRLNEALKRHPELLPRLLLLVDSAEERPAITTPELAYRKFLPLLDGFREERFAVIGVTRRRRFINSEVLTVGSGEFTVVCPKLIFRWALLNHAAAVIVGHNHPSGDSTVSPQDKDVTSRLTSAGKVLGIPVLDHIVLGFNSYSSFAELGLLPLYAPEFRNYVS